MIRLDFRFRRPEARQGLGVKARPNAGLDVTPLVARCCLEGLRTNNLLRRGNSLNRHAGYVQTSVECSITKNS
jgi:hypothetical protein